MLRKTIPVIVCALLTGIASGPVQAAEREEVRKVINLVAAVKMPYPENLPRNRARTIRVWLDVGGATVGLPFRPRLGRSVGVSRGFDVIRIAKFGIK